jgi:hypothetical protein
MRKKEQRVEKKDLKNKIYEERKKQDVQEEDNWRNR